MTQTYTLSDEMASQLYEAALTYPDPDFRAAAKTLAMQNPALRYE